MKISYWIEEKRNVPTGTEPLPKKLIIEAEGDGNLINEIIEKFFKMFVKHPEEMEWRQ